MASKKVKQEDKDRARDPGPRSPRDLQEAQNPGEYLPRGGNVGGGQARGEAVPVEDGKRYCCKRHCHAAQHKE